MGIAMKKPEQDEECFDKATDVDNARKNDISSKLHCILGRCHIVLALAWAVLIMFQISTQPLFLALNGIGCLFCAISHFSFNIVNKSNGLNIRFILYVIGVLFITVGILGTFL